MPLPLPPLRPKSVNPITCSSAGIFCDMFHNSMRVSLRCASSHCCQRMLRWPHTHTLTQTVTMLCVCGGWHCPWRLSICQCPVHFTPLRSPPQFGINFRWAHPPRGLGPPPLALINTCLLSRCSGVRSTPITNCKLMLSKRGRERRRERGRGLPIEVNKILRTRTRSVHSAIL